MSSISSGSIKNYGGNTNLPIKRQVACMYLRCIEEIHNKKEWRMKKSAILELGEPCLNWQWHKPIVISFFYIYGRRKFTCKQKSNLQTYIQFHQTGSQLEPLNLHGCMQHHDLESQTEGVIQWYLPREQAQTPLQKVSIRSNRYHSSIGIIQTSTIAGDAALNERGMSQETRKLRSCILIQ